MKSTIVSMENLPLDEDSNYTTDFSKTPSKANNFDEKQGNYNAEEEKLTGEITKGVANLIWQESSQRAKKAFNTYTNIDILRPYFDVEPNMVKQRLISSLMPHQFYKVDGMKIPRELYGPNMIVLSLVAMLLMQMKTANVSLKEGTLMGSALGLCFGYWVLASTILWFLCYIFNIRLAILQALHLMGYGLFGPCIVIFATTVIHPHSTHSFFYVVALLFVALSTVKMMSVINNRTSDQKSLLILTAFIFCLQFLFLFYIHFSYHHDLEELAFEAPNLTPLHSDKFYKDPNNIVEATIVDESALSTAIKSLKDKLLVESPLNKLGNKFKKRLNKYNPTNVPVL